MAHEKVYAFCENLCKEESLTKTQIIEEILKDSGVPAGGIIDFEGNTIPEGFEEISGADGVVVSPTEPTGGKRKKVWLQKSSNVFDLDKFFNSAPVNNCTKTKTSTGIKLSFTAGADAFIGVASQNGGSVSNLKDILIPVKPNTTYTLSLNNTRNSSYITYVNSNFLAINSTYIQMSNVNKYTFTTPANTSYVLFRFGVRDNSLTEYTFNNIQLEEGANATEYYPKIYKKIYTLNNNGIYEEFYDETNQEIYSTSEIRIGTWVDGKPLYRKVIEFSNNSNAIQDVSLPSNEQPQFFTAFLVDTNELYPITSALTTENNTPRPDYVLRCVATNGTFHINKGSGFLNKGFFRIIYQYTKASNTPLSMGNPNAGGEGE